MLKKLVASLTVSWINRSTSYLALPLITHSGRTLLFLAQIGLPKWPPAAILKIIKKKKVVYWSEMARNVIESDFRSSKMSQIGLPKWLSAAIWKKKKLHIDLKWRVMRSKVISCHPKWPPVAILKKKRKKLCIDLKWREMPLKVIFGHPKWPPAAILWKNKSCVLIWNGEKCHRKWFSVIQNGRQQLFGEKKNQICVLIWNGEKCDQTWFSVIQNGRRQPFCEKSVLIWNGEKCNWKWFSVIQNGHWQPYYKKNKNNKKSDFQNDYRRPFKKNCCILPFCENNICILIWNGEKCDRKWFSVIQNAPILDDLQPFCQFKKKTIKWFSLIQNGCRQPFS